MPISDRKVKQQAIEHWAVIYGKGDGFGDMSHIEVCYTGSDFDLHAL
jgi:hypothetical protein